MSTSPILDNQSMKQNTSNIRMSPVATDTDAINGHGVKRVRSPSFHSHVNDFVEVEIQSHKTGNGKRWELRFRNVLAKIMECTDMFKNMAFTFNQMMNQMVSGALKLGAFG